PRAAAVSGWWFGFGYFFFNLVWVGEAFLVEADKFAWLLPFAITLLPAGLALFYALAAGISRKIWPIGLARVLALAVVMTAIEWLRGHLFTGFPWNVPGYALTAPLELMQSAGLFGIYGLTLIACIVFASPLVVFADEDGTGGPSRVLRAAALGVLPLAALWAYGAWQLSAPQTFAAGVTLRIVQPSVLQTEKWKPEHQRRIFDDHLALSQTNAAGAPDTLDGITHIIWPEAAMPFFPLEAPKALEEIAAMLPDGRTLITGALRRDLSNAAGGSLSPIHAAAFNSILVFDQQARLTASYDKIHLVPFGEYLPFESGLKAIGLGVLTFGRAAFTPGAAPRPMLHIPGLPPVSGLICYEALFPGEIIQTPARPGVLLNVTNDGWFGNSSGPRQHFHQTRVRAAEQGLPVLRAANNGISAVIDSQGRVLQSLGMNVRGVIDSPLPSAGPVPPYARFGDAIVAVLAALAAGVSALLHRRYAR
ncbi:MAG: apolipoprotein N-acyltransferase, partial [Hyphomicrobium sp.]